MKPAKVKFHPLPIVEEKIPEKYINGTYTGIWKAWFDQKFSDLLLLEKHYNEMTKGLYSHATWTSHFQNTHQKIENEILEAARLAGPYLNREA